MTIDLNAWIPEIQALKRGEASKHNHVDCKAGRDHKQRLYLTRPAGSPGIVLAYCHNCQESGYSRCDVTSYRDFDSTRAQPPTVQPIEFRQPTGLEVNPNNWPALAQCWRIDKSLSPAECVNAGISYDPNTHRMYLPQYNELVDGKVLATSELLGYQLRRLDDRGPKYLSAKADDSTPVSTCLTNTSSTSKLVRIGYVVEDLASGLAMIKATPELHMSTSVLVNYGTKVTPEVLIRLTDMKLGVVWLDNDSPHVCDQAGKIARVWNMVSGRPIKVEAFPDDPKNCNRDALKNRMREHIAWSQST